jgi:preprotein translocase subunit YajC
MLNLENVFRGRIESDLARVDRENRVLKAADPFGGLGLMWKVEHAIENGDRVRVHSPGHEAHGMSGKVKDASHSARVEVKLDSGHTVFCQTHELIPEDFPAGGMTDEEAGEKGGKIAAALRAGKIVTMDERFRPVIARTPELRRFAGQIVYQPSLEKRAKPHSFRRGDKVKDNRGRLATIIEAKEAVIEIEYGKGDTAVCLPELVTAVA